jgi:RHS repeat-associated protein
MQGLSDKAIKTNYAENKYRYNGIEYDSTFGLDEYEAHYRDLDPQTGRWWQIDPAADKERESLSPYASMSDDPVFKTDPLGNEDEGCCKGLWDGFMKGVSWINENLNPINDAVELVTGRDYNLEGAPQVNRSEAALGIGLAIVGGKVEGAIVKTVEKAVVKDLVQGSEKGAEKAVEKDLSKAEQRAAKLSQDDRSGKDFTKAGKDAVKDVNSEKNGGQKKCEGCGQPVQDAKKHVKGVTPPPNEAHVDHIDAKSNGGSGTPDNGQVLCRDCNIKKRDH